MNAKKSSFFKYLTSKNNHNILPLLTFSEVLLFDYEKCPVIQLNDSNINCKQKNSKKITSLITDWNKEDLPKYKNYYLSDYCNNGQICIYDKYDIFLNSYGKMNLDDITLKNKTSVFSTLSSNNKDFKCTKMLKNPEVSTTLIYNRLLYTRAAFKYNIKYQKLERPGVKDIYYSEGDGTVTIDSALFGPLKWAYEHKYLKDKKYKPVNIVDYCSPLDDDTTKLAFPNIKEFDVNKHQYNFLNCYCKSKKKKTYSKKFLDSFNDYNCNHSNMLNDPYIIKFLLDLLNSFTHDDTKRHKAILNYTEINTNF